MTRRSASTRFRAFTLIEVLVSLAVLAVLAAAVSSLLWSIDARRDDINRVSAANRAATAIIDRLEQDLATTFVATRDGDAGVAGDGSLLTVRAFATGLAFQSDAEPHRGLTTLRIDAREPEAVSADREAGGDEPEPPPLTDRLSRVRFRYHDGDDWLDSFDSARARRLPIAIEIAVWFAPSERAPATPTELDGIGATSAAGRSTSFGAAADVTGFEPGPAGMEAFMSPSGSSAPPPPDRLRVVALTDAVERSAADEATRDGAFDVGFDGEQSASFGGSR